MDADSRRGRAGAVCAAHFWHAGWRRIIRAPVRSSFPSAPGPGRCHGPPDRNILQEVWPSWCRRPHGAERLLATRVWAKLSCRMLPIRRAVTSAGPRAEGNDDLDRRTG